MAEFARHRSGTMHQLPVEQQPDADALRHGHRHDVVDVFGVAAEPEFGQRTRVGGVLDVDRQTHRGLDHLGELHRSPAQVRRKHQSAAVVDAPGQADAHALA